ncbi:double-strand break repair helicase AddA [Marinicaulis aureus]|uniref:DNA 3'-5' helicase n=1 Tax=Hyphococcus aureus TaxID=2666033 RepID=A0ABW1KVL2_9PROT
MTPLQETTNNQRHAADPARSVFVMANAGSGKTRVLTNRVARLLLDGAPPQKILCITFTKAAAAEMAERLFSVLGEWALASDEKLLEELSELEGADTTPKSADDLAQARRLFARALETPGGLKIQTIHSFCESVLRRFPIEAGAPPGFTVVEDAQAAALMNAALDAVALSASEDAALASAFDRLSRKRIEGDLRQLLIAAASGGGVADIDAAAAALANKLAINPDETADTIKRDFLKEISVDELRRAHNGLAAEGKQPQAAAQRLSAYFTAQSDEERWDALTRTFLVANQSKTVDKIASKATDKHDPWVGPYVNTLKELVFSELQAIRAHTLYDDTLAFWRLTAALATAYAEAKAARAMLDFNDLIARAEALFQRHEAAWIMYKLDYGIDHILIDEAQDTSPGQWAVVENLFADYFSGLGAREISRSFFAVGDMKQSIYSFQGADVGLFKAKEFDLGEKLSAITEYRNIPLTMSFRTTEPVLSFVDAAFNDPAAAEGLGEFPIPAHGVCREGAAGLVEIWPLTPRPEKPEINPWDAPVDATEASHPVRVLCDRVAAQIKGWLESGEPLESRGRAIRAGDIMILVQSRGALFREIIQRLSTAGVPVAGPDRLKLADDPAVEDLLSYARFALTQSDDLSLAEILKSPLFGFDDDDDLFPLAYGRGKSVTLWRSLRARAGENEKWKAAAEEIMAARVLARAQGPYSFFSHVLETGSIAGRQRFFERLGEASSDAMDELLRQALDFENGNPRSLREFVAWFDGASGDIKREMERENQSVRVMTVHGAKGLEADIVFLLDAHREANIRNIGPLLVPPSDAGLPNGAPLLAWSKAEDAPLSAEAREEKTRLAYEEYRRLFYVAATRARDRLFICGIEQGNRKNPQDKETGLKSWHSLAHDGFARLLERVETGETPFWEGGDAPLLRLSCQQTAAVKNDDPPGAKASVETPPWLKQKAPEEPAPLRLTPSKLDGEEERASAPLVGDGAAYSPVAGGDKYFRGRTLHRLLELLPEVAAEKRRGAADRLLERLAPDIDDGERARWRDEVLHVLDDPQFAQVFAPGSIAETPIVGRPKGLPDSARLNGQIDRLAVSQTRVLVVDYKTNRPPPKRVEDADPAYVAQLAAYRALLQEIYPDHEIVCALLWTFDARLMAVPSEMLDHAFARLRLT